MENTGRSGREERAYRERLLQDAERIEQKDIDALEESVPRKVKGMAAAGLEEGTEWLGAVVAKVRSLYAMIFDKGYRLPTKTKLVVAAGLLYFVVPTDMLPDFIPGIGYIDDAMVLGALWKMVSTQVDAYERWRAGETSPLIAASEEGPQSNDATT